MTASAGIAVRATTEADVEVVLRIYQAGIDGGLAGFETTAPAWETFDEVKLPDHRFVAELDGRVVGWLAVSQVSARAVYAGVGLALLQALLASTDAAGIWTVQSAVFPDNTASLRPHRRADRADHVALASTRTGTTLPDGGAA